MSKKAPAKVGAKAAAKKQAALDELTKKEEEELARQAQLAEAAAKEAAAEEVALEDEAAVDGELVAAADEAAAADETAQTIAEVAESLDHSSKELAASLSDNPLMFAQAAAGTASGGAAAAGTVAGISTTAIVAGVAVVGVAAAAGGSSSSGVAAPPIEPNVVVGGDISAPLGISPFVSNVAAISPLGASSVTGQASLTNSGSTFATGTATAVDPTKATVGTINSQGNVLEAGTSGNDLLKVTSAQLTTLTTRPDATKLGTDLLFVGGQIDGGAGTDMLVMELETEITAGTTADDLNKGRVYLKDIEVVGVKNTEAAATTREVDTEYFGSKELWNWQTEAPATGVKFQNIQSTDTVIGVYNTATATTAEFKTTLTGTSVTAVLDKALTGSTLALTTGEAVKTVEISSNGSSSTTTNLLTKLTVGSKVETVKLYGDRAVTLGDGTETTPITATVKAVDASGMKGAFTLKVNSGVTDTNYSVEGGFGKNTVEMTGADGKIKLTRIDEFKVKAVDGTIDLDGSAGVKLVTLTNANTAGTTTSFKNIQGVTKFQASQLDLTDATKFEFKELSDLSLTLKGAAGATDEAKFAGITTTKAQTISIDSQTLSTNVGAAVLGAVNLSSDAKLLSITNAGVANMTAAAITSEQTGNFTALLSTKEVTAQNTGSLTSTSITSTGNLYVGLTAAARVGAAADNKSLGVNAGTLESKSGLVNLKIDSTKAASTSSSITAKANVEIAAAATGDSTVNYIGFTDLTNPNSSVAGTIQSKDASVIIDSTAKGSSTSRAFNAFGNLQALDSVSISSDLSNAGTYVAGTVTAENGGITIGGSGTLGGKTGYAEMAGRSDLAVIGTLTAKDDISIAAVNSSASDTRQSVVVAVNDALATADAGAGTRSITSSGGKLTVDVRLTGNDSKIAIGNSAVHDTPVSNPVDQAGSDQSYVRIDTRGPLGQVTTAAFTPVHHAVSAREEVDITAQVGGSSVGNTLSTLAAIALGNISSTAKSATLNLTLGNDALLNVGTVTAESNATVNVTSGRGLGRTTPDGATGAAKSQIGAILSNAGDATVGVTLGSTSSSASTLTLGALTATQGAVTLKGTGTAASATVGDGGTLTVGKVTAKNDVNVTATLGEGASLNIGGAAADHAIKSSAGNVTIKVTTGAAGATPGTVTLGANIAGNAIDAKKLLDLDIRTSETSGNSQAVTVGTATNGKLSGETVKVTFAGLGNGTFTEGGGGNVSIISTAVAGATGNVIENKFSGTADVKVALTATKGNKTLTDASGLTSAADLTILNSAGNDSIIGGAGNDTITLSTNNGDNTVTGGLGADTIAAGSGKDVITLNGGDNTVDTAGVGETTIKVTESGTNTLNVTGTKKVTVEVTGGSDAKATVDVATSLNGLVDASTSTKGIIVTGFDTASTVTGGSGNDSITGGAGADSIMGGAGDDTIVSGGGKDTIDGGAGNDVFVTKAADTTPVVFDGTIDGGAGVNTIWVLEGEEDGDNFSFAGATLSNIQAVKVVSSATTGAAATTETDVIFDAKHISGKEIAVTSAVADSTVAVNGTATADTIDASKLSFTIGTTATGITFDGKEGDDTIIGGAGNDTIIGGTGVDTIKISAGTANVINDLGVGGEADVVELTGGKVTATVTGNWTATNKSFNRGADNEAFVINVAGANTVNLAAASALTTDKGFTVNSITNGTGAITGSARADILVNKAGAASFTGGLGNDTFISESTDLMTITDLTTGDIIKTEVGAANVLTATNVSAFVATVDTENAGSGVVTLEAAATASTIDLSLVTKGAGGYTIKDGAGNDTLTGSTLADKIFSAAGTDVVKAGAGGDTVIVTGRTAVTGMTFDGEAGTDTLAITGLTAIDFSTSGVTLQGFEILDLKVDAAGAVDAGKVQTVTFTAAQRNQFTTAVTVDATDKITVNTLNGATVAGSDAIDTFVVAASDTGVSITDFTTTEDFLNLDALTTTTALAAATADTITAGEVYLVTSVVAGEADSLAGAVAAINASGVWTDATAGQKAYFVVADNNSSGLFEYTAVDTAGVQVGELKLMANIGAVLVAADIVFA